ncbi:hypothetical protein BVG19_g3008 [[Candida] boidinii]|nr:hypothetical protein BVG19_g3008 [[Candida] boidinii]OWB51991.1 hypothetical protein B5S27_g3562 [[Candida] boidinii]
MSRNTEERENLLEKNKKSDSSSSINNNDKRRPSVRSEYSDADLHDSYRYDHDNDEHYEEGELDALGILHNDVSSPAISGRRRRKSSEDPVNDYRSVVPKEMTPINTNDTNNTTRNSNQKISNSNNNSSYNGHFSNSFKPASTSSAAPAPPSGSYNKLTATSTVTPSKKPQASSKLRQVVTSNSNGSESTLQSASKDISNLSSSANTQKKMFYQKPKVVAPSSTNSNSNRNTYNSPKQPNQYPTYGSMDSSIRSSHSINNMKAFSSTTPPSGNHTQKRTSLPFAPLSSSTVNTAIGNDIDELYKRELRLHNRRRHYSISSTRDTRYFANEYQNDYDLNKLRNRSFPYKHNSISGNSKNIHNSNNLNDQTLDDLDTDVFHSEGENEEDISLYQPSNPSSRRSSDVSSLDDVCFPIESLDEAGKKKIWPDVSILEDFANEEIENSKKIAEASDALSRRSSFLGKDDNPSTADSNSDSGVGFQYPLVSNIDSGSLTEPLVLSNADESGPINGRLRPSRITPWDNKQRMEQPNLPQIIPGLFGPRGKLEKLRFTYFRESLENTIHSPSISGLLHKENLSFSDLFVPSHYSKYTQIHENMDQYAPPYSLSPQQTNSNLAQDQTETFSSIPEHLSSSDNELQQDDPLHFDQNQASAAAAAAAIADQQSNLSQQAQNLAQKLQIPLLQQNYAASVNTSTKSIAPKTPGFTTPTPGGSIMNESTATTTATPVTDYEPFWLDVLNPTEEEMKVISKAFGIHPLTTEDIFLGEAREKVELFKDYYFVCFTSFDVVQERKRKALEKAMNSANGQDQDENSPTTMKKLMKSIFGNSSSNQSSKSKENLKHTDISITSKRSKKKKHRGDELEPLNMYIIVFRDAVITFHFKPTPHPINVRRRARLLSDYLNVNSDWICYALIDDITDAYGPLIESIETEVNAIEDAILVMQSGETSDSESDEESDEEEEDDPIWIKLKRRSSGAMMDGDKRSMLSLSTRSSSSTMNTRVLSWKRKGDMLRRIGECRKRVMSLLRLLGFKADVIKGFAKRCNELWESSPRSEIGMYLGDIQDHLVTMVQSLNHYEKLLARAHSNYLAQINIDMTKVNNDMNDVLGKITILGTIVLPLNIVTGLWGMNCLVPGQDVDSLDWFWGITACMFVFAFTAYFLAKRVTGM